MDNSIMKLTVTTDDKIGNDSKTFVLNFPFDKQLPNALFDIGLVTDVDGYKNLEVLVAKQEGFKGEVLVGKKLKYADLVYWEDFADKLSRRSEDARFHIEAYMRFYLNEKDFFYIEDNCDNIVVIRCDKKKPLENHLANMLRRHYHMTNTLPEAIAWYIDWDKVLGYFLEEGLGMVYEGHYVFLESWCLDKDFQPQPRRLARTLQDWIDEGEYPADLNKSLLNALPNIRFRELYHMLNNGEPLAPAFLDNDVRHEVFYALACAVGTDIPNKLIEGYEKIWVKPVNNN